MALGQPIKARLCKLWGLRFYSSPFSLGTDHRKGLPVLEVKGALRPMFEPWPGLFKAFSAALLISLLSLIDLRSCRGAAWRQGAITLIAAHARPIGLPTTAAVRDAIPRGSLCENAADRKLRQLQSL